MEVDEITIPSPDFPNGETFGPVTLERGHEGPVDPRRELPVTFVLERRRMFGVDWYSQIYHARGVFSVVRDQVTLALTDAPVVIERASWWRRVLVARTTTSSNHGDGRCAQSPLAQVKRGSLTHITSSALNEDFMDSRTLTGSLKNRRMDGQTYFSATINRTKLFVLPERVQAGCARARLMWRR